jgi:hypothetical protein
MERQSIVLEERYDGARITSLFFKTFAFLWLVAGAIVIYKTDKTYGNNGSTGNSLIIAIAIEIAATLLGAAMFAFSAYVLDLLRGIWEEVAGEND